MSKVQIRKIIETPILGANGKPTKKMETSEDTRIVYEVDFKAKGSWAEQGYEVIAEQSMNFKKQVYGGSDDD